MLDRESACNRDVLARRFVLFGADGGGLRFEPARSPGRCPEIDNVVTAALLPHQPDQLRRRHDRYDNGEDATLWTYRRRNGTKRKSFNDFSHARMHARARDGLFGVW